MRERRALVYLLACCLVAADSKDEAFTGSRRNYWAFVKPTRPTVPQLTHNWIRPPVDAFLLDAGHNPRPALDRAKLLRRVTLDLTGLPPTPVELQAFLTDSSPEAYRKVVDRLLA